MRKALPTMILVLTLGLAVSMPVAAADGPSDELIRMGLELRAFMARALALVIPGTFTEDAPPQGRYNPIDARARANAERQSVGDIDPIAHVPSEDTESFTGVRPGG